MKRETLRKEEAKHYNKDNAIKCEVCGKYFRKVGAHVVQAHGYNTAREYRIEYGFDVRRGQVPEEDRKVLANNCRKNHTINNLKQGAKYRFKKGDKVGRYKRSAQTMERLKQSSMLKNNLIK